MPKSDCREELQLLFDAAESFVEPALGHHRPWAKAMDRTRAALAQPEPTPPLEPRGCPTPGACSCPTAPTVPPDLIRALELAEAGLSDIGDADREPGDDLAWAEARAAQDLPRIRRTLNTWRDHSALAQPEPVAPTDDELWAVGNDDFRANCYPTDAIRFARAVLARWGTLANNTRRTH